MTDHSTPSRGTQLATSTARQMAEAARVQVYSDGFPAACLARAQQIALLFGGNGLTTTEQVYVVAALLRDHDTARDTEVGRLHEELAEWRAWDLKRRFNDSLHS